MLLCVGTPHLIREVCHKAKTSSIEPLFMSLIVFMVNWCGLGYFITCERQTIRNNVQAEGQKDYSGKSITVYFLDYTLNEIKQYLPIYAPDTLCGFSWFHL